jgi:hypothetical protein
MCCRLPSCWFGRLPLVGLVLLSCPCAAPADNEALVPVDTSDRRFPPTAWRHEFVGVGKQ